LREGGATYEKIAEELSLATNGRHAFTASEVYAQLNPAKRATQVLRWQRAPPRGGAMDAHRLNASDLTDDQQAALKLLLGMAPAAPTYAADRTQARAVFDELVELGWVTRVRADDEVGYCLTEDAAITIGITVARMGAAAANN
jgi:hypothetical protein